MANKKSVENTTLKKKEPKKEAKKKSITTIEKDTGEKKEKSKKKKNEKSNLEIEETKLENLTAKEKSTKNKLKEKGNSKKEHTIADNKRNETVSLMSGDEMTRLLKIILVLIVIVVAFYGLTVLITKWRKTSTPERDKTITPAVIQYDEILIGTLLNQSRSEYYVLIQADDDPYQSLTSYYISNYERTKEALKVYTSNLNSGLNSYYISETSNLKVEKMNDFRVSKVTLVYVKDHKIVKAYEGLDAVCEALKELVKSEN